MKFLDFHCDTIGECCLQNKSLFKNDLHIDLQRASAFSAYGQLFAIWIPDEKRGETAFSYYCAVRDRFYQELLQHAPHIAQCCSAADVQSAFFEKKTAAILTVEGGSVLNGQIERLDTLYQDGVRLMTLTWNDSNAIGNGCFAENKGGLTEFGKAVVQKMQEMRILVDVSHLNERGFFDVAEYTKKPFLASHSNAKIVDNPYANARNLTDAQIRVLTERGGLIGLNLCADFLGNNGQTGMDAVLRHIVHFLDCGAQKNLAFGCDFDGCTVHPALNGIETVPRLMEYLLKHGLSESVLEDIFFQNGYRFLVANL